MSESEDENSDSEEEEYPPMINELDTDSDGMIRIQERVISTEEVSMEDLRKPKLHKPPLLDNN